MKYKEIKKDLNAIIKTVVEVCQIQKQSIDRFCKVAELYQQSIIDDPDLNVTDKSILIIDLQKTIDKLIKQIKMLNKGSALNAQDFKS